MLFVIFHSARNCLENTTANLQSSLQSSNIHSPQLQPNSYWISNQHNNHIRNFKNIWQFGRLLDPVSFNFHQSGRTTLKCVTASHHIISPTPTLFEESRLVTRGTCAFRGIRPNEDSKGGRKWTKQNNLFRPFPTRYFDADFWWWCSSSWRVFNLFMSCFFKESHQNAQFESNLARTKKTKTDGVFWWTLFPTFL